jgi:hypothetical protein
VSLEAVGCGPRGWRTTGERSGNQTATAGKEILGGMREPHPGRSDGSGFTNPLGATAMQRDDQTLAGPPREQRHREQQRRQQIQAAFDQDVGHSHDGGSYRQIAPLQALDAARRPGWPW